MKSKRCAGIKGWVRGCTCTRAERKAAHQAWPESCLRRGRACTQPGPASGSCGPSAEQPLGLAARRSWWSRRQAVAPRKPSWTRWVWTEQDERTRGVLFHRGLLSRKQGRAWSWGEGKDCFNIGETRQVLCRCTGSRWEACPSWRGGGLQSWKGGSISPGLWAAVVSPWGTSLSR